MFKAANPYDEIVGKATDENLTSENWQLNLDVCDKVSNDGESGARNCVGAILKRLVHRNANVQLYALTLSDALSKNCGLVAHRELASRNYCQTLQRIIADRNTHATVKRKGVSLIKAWSDEWGQDESLGIMRETMQALKTAGVSFRDEAEEPPPTTNEPSSEQLRAEDEELRRVLELSLHDQGGRDAGFSSSLNATAGASSSTAAGAGGMSSATGAGGEQDKLRTDPSLGRVSSAAPSTSIAAAAAAPPTAAVAAQGGQLGSIASRVRALYDFTPTEEGELAFQKGEVIRVLDSVYEHWWRGELRGEAGIFPVNYVELLPDPTPADIQREAELEAHIFAQANDIDRLLSKLRGLDPARDNLADDEELQELYQSSLTMRPKIVKLIDRYNLKVNELRTMNDKFVRARATFDAMMEESLARYDTAPTASHWHGSAHQQSSSGVDAVPYFGSASHPSSHQASGFGPMYQSGDSIAQQQPPHQHQHEQQQQLQQQHPQAQSSQPAYSPSMTGPQQSSQQHQQPPTPQGQQQQQEYAQAWANWYAQQQQQPQASSGHQAQGHSPQLVQQHASVQHHQA